MLNKKSPIPKELSHNQFSSDTHIEGHIKGKGNYRIDGILDGDIYTSGKIVIGQNGKVAGNITCAEADVSGTIKGTVKASVLLSLRKTASIEGEVFINQLIVEPGANLNAKCQMKKLNVKEPEKILLRDNNK